MNEPDIRWKQRFENYQNALIQLTDAVVLYQQRPLSGIEQQGFVKAFEFTHELAWKVMKDYFLYQGNTRIMGSRDATRQAFQNQIISDGEGWMEMIRTRNRAVHAYDKAMVTEIIQKTVEVYYPLLIDFELEMKKIAAKE
ncbi:MAG: nucleotidyltransferase substrate binding protein [Proteobacteria bacterium]|nr:nucleotidyltransferase substrate binding protein [Pseudomonadota bacterium]MBU1388718.1 nucleotidyltransferase substrate binding protein [Pseudomonadota bacterium]MBU1543059.1 nucleotidyltransferase substrate binding protein [Pseudomonadota bacterium]